MTRCWLSETHIAITPEGKMKPCTRYKDTIHSPNINDVSLQDVFFNEYFRKPREQLKSNQFPDACSKCSFQEENGIQSMRQIFNMNSDFQSLNGTIDDIRSLEIAFSNHCNYRCRHCNSYSSAKWRKEDIEVFNLPVPEKMLVEPNIENININNLVNLEHIKILGGEPFINKTHAQFMRELSKRDCSHIALEYVTNGSVLPTEEILDIWKQFKSVTIYVSLDDIGKYFNYFRTDADFYEEVEPNCFVYDELMQENNINLNMHFHIVINVLNMYRLDKIVNYIFEEFPQWKLTVDTVINPSWLKISQWSKLEENTMIYYLRFQKYSTNLEHNIKVIDNMCRILSANCINDDNNFTELMKYNSLLDKSRNTDLLSIHEYIKDKL